MIELVNPTKEKLSLVYNRTAQDIKELEEPVKLILERVRLEGDAAVRKFTKQFDHSEPKSLLVSKKELAEAGNSISDELKEAIDLATRNIRKFHESQRIEEAKVETMPGILCWRKSVPISKVGLYIPSGSAPLFSSLLMLGIPAQIAGCSEIIVCARPDEEGNIHPAILYTAHTIGITKLFKIGGVQAIAAMAYGTESVPKTDKLFGPGNAFVTAAKQYLSGKGIAIDLPAGPSELAILADDSAVPAYVAADLLSQAEHGADSQVVLISTSDDLIKKVKREVEHQVKKLPRNEIAENALKNSYTILVSDLSEGLEIINEYAPEHLLICCKRDLAIAEKVVNAGSVFLGNFSPESVGDYASGTNHTLPTQGFAKAYSGVSLDSFMKKITFQKLSKEGLKSIGPAVEVMANAEGLEGHRRAVSIRNLY
jgi:histidinol dehydrogenase